MALYRGGKKRLPVGISVSGNGNAHLNKPTSSASTRRLARLRVTIMLILLFVVVVGSFYLSYGVAMENMKQQEESARQIAEQRPQGAAKVQTDEEVDSKQTGGRSPSPINRDKCAFRSYPSNRLYGLSSKSQPKFLSEAAYIRGQWPIIINPSENDNKILADGESIRQTPPVKVCIDTTSWEDLVDESGKERLPFTDGHNPSVISLAPNPYSDSPDRRHERIDPRHLEPIASAFPSAPLSSLFLGVTIFGGGQCKFGLSPEDVDHYRFSLRDEPPGGKRAVVALLAPPNVEGGGDGGDRRRSPFRTLAQTTLLLERDVRYGTARKRAIQPERVGSGFARMHQEFDDPRLFFHLGRVWILYRNGPLFGYQEQIHNPIHFEEAGDGVGFVAYVKASETVRVGGGRNIALISEEPIGRDENGIVEWAPNPSLKALTWVDPVTVRDDIDLNGAEEKLRHRRLREADDASGSEGGERDAPRAAAPLRLQSQDESDSAHPRTERRRRLGSKPTKSNVHGTNGYMAPLPSSGELLGIAHFHRPENRKSSEFALHGHHYTHAFFTIARQAGGGADAGSRPFKLRRLSNEFVFRANSVPAGETRPPADGDIIQFASGIDVVGSDVDGRLIVSYGINDCEGSVFTLAMQLVQNMLIEVDPGQEVVDLMENVRRR